MYITLPAFTKYIVIREKKVIQQNSKSHKPHKKCNKRISNKLLITISQWAVFTPTFKYMCCSSIFTLTPVSAPSIQKPWFINIIHSVCLLYPCNNKCTLTCYYDCFFQILLKELLFPASFMRLKFPTLKYQLLTMLAGNSKDDCSQL